MRDGSIAPLNEPARAGRERSSRSTFGGGDARQRVTVGASDPEHRRSSNLQLGRSAQMTSDTSPRPISPLRGRLIEVLSVPGLNEDPRRDYVRHVRSFAAFISRSPDTASPEDLRLFQLHQT